MLKIEYNKNSNMIIIQILKIEYNKNLITIKKIEITKN